MQNAKELIIQKLELIVKEMVGEDEKIFLDTPEDSKNGDYSSNIALKLSKKLGKSPREIAEQIQQVISSRLTVHGLEKVEVAGAGFLNFYLSQDYLLNHLGLILKQKDHYGYSDVLEKTRIMVEFTDPNPLKEFHIGHLYSNTIGESIARLFESQGAQVWRVNYQGDVGLHVAKAMWAILKNREAFEDLENKPIESKANFLGKAYAQGAKAFDSEESKQEIIELNKKIYDKDPEVYPLYEKAKQWSLDYFETIYKRLGTTFKRYYFESEVGPVGLEIIKDHMGDIFIEDAGAIVFPKEKSGLHTRVFVNSLGIPTYEGKELGLPSLKHADFPYDKSVIVTGNEINEYFKVLLKALSLVEPDLAKKTHHIGHGMVRLPSGKMSSRTGDVITGEFLLSEAKRKLFEAHPEMSSDIAEEIAVGAIKYAFLKSGIGQDITFSIEESISIHGNSGPYLQYAYARTQSVLGKVKSQNAKAKIENQKLEVEEMDLLRFLVQFPEVVARAQTEFAPNYMCTYLFNLTQKFSAFYEKHRVIGENQEVQDFRLGLVAGVGQVIKNGLYLLGIQTPDKI